MNGAKDVIGCNSLQGFVQGGSVKKAKFSWINSDFGRVSIGNTRTSPGGAEIMDVSTHVPGSEQNNLIPADAQGFAPLSRAKIKFVMDLDWEKNRNPIERELANLNDT